MRKFQNILVTGGCGFIGVNFIKYLFNESDFAGNIINVDILTYAGNPLSLEDIKTKYNTRYNFYKTDICNKEEINKILFKHNIDCIVHFAAESHVDRSILGPKDFITTNIEGTFNILDASKNS